ncbi:MAG: glycosyltransferase family 2 protein [Bacteroidales bacterium]|nr:glycosyltransferase family 2 protein [Bacteroidales bacterium]
MKELVSIVIPVYNGEKTLKRCVDSLLKQKYSNIEILLIDNGSTDLSSQICEEYVLKDARVRCFHKQHEGIAVAKNFGLNKSTGSWITFCRQNDFADNIYIYSFFYRGKLHKDCLYITGEKEGKKENKLKKVKGIHCSGPICQKMLDKVQNNAECQGKLYNRKVINRLGLHFKENISYGEDKLFTMQYLKEINEIAYNRKYFPYIRIIGDHLSVTDMTFNEQWNNYHEITTELKRIWPDNWNFQWFFSDFKLVFYSILTENNISRIQRIKNLQKIRDDYDTKFILEELIKQKSKGSFFWKYLLKRKYNSVLFVFSIASITGIRKILSDKYLLSNSQT